MPGQDMDHRKERMKKDCKKIIESINSMCFENMNDEQVHSLVTMREIARGVVENRVGKVTTADVKKAVSLSIEQMVDSCRDLVNILGMISGKGLGDEELHKVLRMKDIAMGVVTKRSLAAAACGYEPGEQGDVADDDDGNKRKVCGGGVEVEIRNEDDQNGVGQSIVDGEPHTWNGYVPTVVTEAEMNIVEYPEVTRNEDVLNVVHGCLVDGSVDTNREEQFGRVEGLMFEDDCLVVVSELANEDSKSSVQKALSQSTPQHAISWPSNEMIDCEWIHVMMFALEQLSFNESQLSFCNVVPVSLVDKLIDTASSILCEEPNCVEVDCPGEDARVVVVGDIHGQFQDLLHLFEHAGLPSDNQYYVFNGNYVNRGARGLDVFLVLLAWKILMPTRVYLLRGNHESRYCTSVHGFEEEVKTKFGDHGEYVYNKCLNCFKELPLASVIANCVYTTHGGLFRSICHASLRSKRKREDSLELGSLEDLSKVNRYLIDVPDGGPDILLTDVLWSDPSKADGLVEKTFRERGLWWGPDCTEAFLKQSNLKLIIRSHEGPDVRADQDEFGDMLSGYSLDHAGESGKLYTLFSAPHYPQSGEKRYNNEGVYALLKPPNLESPSFHSFNAERRPQSDPSMSDPSVADADKDMVILVEPYSEPVLIIRSHEGPDVRADQDEFGDMLSGYSLDDAGESGKLYTLFSAPHYPQSGEKRYNNEGVYALLKPPNLESPSFHSFNAERRPLSDPSMSDPSVADGDKDMVILVEPYSEPVVETGNKGTCMVE